MRIHGFLKSARGAAILMHKSTPGAIHSQVDAPIMTGSCGKGTNHGSAGSEQSFVVSVLALVCLAFVLAWKQFRARFR